MNLIISTVGVDSGLLWEQNLNSSLLTVDQHNHTSGSGVQIPTAGLNINSDLPLNSNNLTMIRSLRLAVQSAPLSSGSDLSCLYASGAAGNLFFNDGAGNQIQITTGGTVNATSSGISSGTASASFVSSVLVVNAATNTPANIKGASLLLGNNIAASNYLTLSPPTAMASSFGLVLPNIPVSTSFMQLDSSGNMGAAIAVLGGITRQNLAAVGQQISSSCGAFNTSSLSLVDVTNLTITITTSGRPVYLCLIPDGISTANIQVSTVATSGNNGATIAILRAGSIISTASMNQTPANSSALTLPPGVISFLDPVGAGTYTYKIQTLTFGSSTSVAFANIKLAAYEL